MFLHKWFSFRKPASPSREELMNAFQLKYVSFRDLIQSNSELLKIISDIEEKLRGEVIFGQAYIEAQTTRALFHTGRMISALEKLSGRQYPLLYRTLEQIQAKVKQQHAALPFSGTGANVLPYAEINRDMAESVGEKNANLGEVMNRVGLPVPRGFAITAAAFKNFVLYNDLGDRIRNLKAKTDILMQDTIIEASEKIQQLFPDAQIPEDMKADILRAYGELRKVCAAEGRELRIALRSSAIGEDSFLSFAGQYLTVLNVPEGKVFEEYKRVVASLFTPRALSYRLHMGIPFEESAMCVACLEMVDAKVSGVMYTRNPVRPHEEKILITAVWGLGPYAVDGVIPPDTFVLDRKAPHAVLKKRISDKSARIIAGVEGYLTEERVKPEERQAACLTEEQAQELAVWGMGLENHFGTPQDVEWALDRQGRMVVLQTRPLRLEGPGADQPVPLERISEYPLLVEGGESGCAGVGFGRVFHVRTDADLREVPDRCVLVAPHTSPQFVMVMPKVSAIVTDAGNVTGHMASLAREYMVPTILNASGASRLIPEEAEVTVDAYNGRVYLGKVAELINIRVSAGGFMKSSPVWQVLRERADLILPLNLINPKSPAFSAQNCRTVHDIMRLIHETSYKEIFQLGDFVTDRGKISVQLDAPLPIDLYIIDLGGGLEDAEKRRKVRPEQVTSVPFRALLTGMLHEDLHLREPRPLEMRGFFSVMSRQMLSPPNIGEERFGDRSYAIVSDRYLNFSSRVGYHYSILDCYCGLTPTKNYINFEFKGGAADDVRRNRRARLIEKILSESGFWVETVGDRVTARYTKHSAEEISEKLDTVGRLLIFTRQMDMLMHSEGCISALAECFHTGNYAFDSDMLTNVC
ncbi:MAG: PEP/pyruvate-binding domain-containing protein [Desulfobacterales bacterium]